MAELVAGVKAIEMDGLVWGVCTPILSIVSTANCAAGPSTDPSGKVPFALESEEAAFANNSPTGYGIKKLQIVSRSVARVAHHS